MIKINKNITQILYICTIVILCDKNNILLLKSYYDILKIWRYFMQYRKDKYGKDISILGYGCMRFSKKGNSINLEKAEEEIMNAINNGVNYFDTAYIYPGSEEALGKILEKNKVRDKIYIATKLPQYLIKSKASLDKYFDEQLKRLKTDHIDYYLMHMLTDIAAWEKLKNWELKNG